MSVRSIIAIVAILGAVVVLPLVLRSDRGAPAQAGAVAVGEGAPAQDAPRPRFVDLGTTTCIPCKVMLGVMDELRGRVGDSLVVEFVNVKEDPDAMDRYDVQVIPTQIFFAPDGTELFRHRGVIKVDAILAKWAELGHPIQLADGAR